MVEQNRKDLKLHREIVAMSNTRKMLEKFSEMKDVFVQAAQSFNAIRDEMARAKNVIWGLDVYCKQYVSEMTSLIGNDAMSYVAKVWDVQPNEVEDAEHFENIVKGIKDTANPLLKMRKCTKVRNALNTSIESWTSKIRSMKYRAERADGNQNEVDICNRKVISFHDVVSDLEKRNATVFSIFHAAKRDIESFLENQSKLFDSK